MAFHPPQPELLPGNWDPIILATMHQTGDPAADNLICGLAKEGPNAIREFSRLIHQSGPMQVEQMPESAQSFIRDHSKFPDWTDWEKIHTGQAVFSSYGPEISLLFYFRSLPAIYSCPRIADVFYQSYMRDPSPRTYAHQLMGIAQFIVDVMSPGGFSESGNAIDSALKARLIHALIRYHIGKHTPKVEGEGPPINQIDMAIPILTSTSLILRGMEKLGMSLTTEEAEGYCYCWKLATYFIGVLPELVPDSAAEAHQITEAVLDAYIEPNQPGVELTRQMCGLFNKMGPFQYIGLGPEALLYLYAGEKMAKGLEVVEPSGMFSSMVPSLWNNSISLLWRGQRNIPIIRGIAKEMNPFLLQRSIDYLREA